MADNSNKASLKAINYFTCVFKFKFVCNYPVPDAAPPPARPMKCPLPMLLANKEAPI